jgi:hypothetical protein
LKELVLKLPSHVFFETNAKYWSSACGIHGKMKPSITADIAYLGSVPEGGSIQLERPLPRRGMTGVSWVVIMSVGPSIS